MTEYNDRKMNTSEIRPNTAELEFLNLSYSRFYALYEEIMSDNFYKKNKKYRFYKIKDVFLVYSELLNYKPLKWVLKSIKQTRPPMESKIAKDLFKFIRNIVIHFPFFDSWSEIWINKNIVNWIKEGQSIDKFLNTYTGHKQIKYRMWNPDKKKMTYLDINFPSVYSEEKIYLKNILTEKDGILFAVNMMKNVLDTQLIK